MNHQGLSTIFVCWGHKLAQSHASGPISRREERRTPNRARTNKTDRGFASTLVHACLCLLRTRFGALAMLPRDVEPFLFGGANIWPRVTLPVRFCEKFGGRNELRTQRRMVEYPSQPIHGREGYGDGKNQRAVVC